jgi:hypothetical protein
MKPLYSGTETLERHRNGGIDLTQRKRGSVLVCKTSGQIKRWEDTHQNNNPRRIRISIVS